MRVLKARKLFPLTVFLFYMGLKFLAGGFPVEAVIGLGVSIVLLITFGGFEAVTEYPFEDSTQYKECIVGPLYDLEDRLRLERENKEKYWTEQRNSWKKGVFGAVVYLLCSAVTLWLFSVKDSMFLWFCGEFFSMAGEFWALTWIWDSYINSGAVLAAKISRKFMIRSTSVRIEECSKMIGAMQRKLQEKSDGSSAEV